MRMMITTVLAGHRPIKGADAMAGDEDEAETIKETDMQNCIHFKGFLLSSLTSIEYELVAILRSILDEAGGYWIKFNDAVNTKARGKFGRKNTIS